jgi:hypothetical protein
MSRLLDPWSDAQVIALRLARFNERLVVGLGAEAWCEKCRALRPLFEARAAQAAPNELWLWLDLEDHAQFIGDFQPDDLPWLLVYAGPALMHCAAIGPGIESLDGALAQVAVPGPAIADDSGVHARLLHPDWAY